jgi:hypothetical protein
MDNEKQIIKKLTQLSEAKQQQVLDFIDFLAQKRSESPIPDLSWSKFSLNSALADNLDEDFAYTLDDIKIKFQ